MSGVSCCIHFVPRKIQKHCTVKLLQVNGTGKEIIAFQELAAFSPDDNIRLKAVRKEQMKHDGAIKHKQRMSVRPITCI